MALESGVRRDPTLLVSVAERARRQGSRGTARIQRVLAKRPPGAPPTGSELETRFLQLVRRSAVVREPERQVRVLGYYLDVVWPAWSRFAELDGKAWHDDRPGAAPYDRDRKNEIVIATGWLPLRYGWADVVHRPNTTLRKLEPRGERVS